MPPPSISGGTRSPQTEQLLSDRGFVWDFRENVDLQEFDDTRSLQNQARIGKPVDEDTVNRYVGALSNGDVFPAIIAATQPRRKLLRVDGNHRAIAHKTFGAKVIDCYVIIDGNPQGLALLTFELNTKHGLPTSEKERILQAMHLMDGGVSAEDAAKRLGIKVHTLRQAANLAAVDQRAEVMGIEPTKWRKLPAGIKNRLGQVGTDEGFAEMAHLTIAADLKTDQVSRAVSDLNLLRSSSKQVEYVEELQKSYRVDLQTGGARADKPPVGRKQRSARQLYTMALQQFSVLPTAQFITTHMDEHAKVDLMHRTEAAIVRLVAIRDALKK